MGTVRGIGVVQTVQNHINSLMYASTSHNYSLTASVMTGTELLPDNVVSIYKVWYILQIHLQVLKQCRACRMKKLR